MQRHGRIPQLRSRNSGHPDVDGHRLHVETVTGHAVSMSTKKFVAPGRAVAADDVDFKIGIPECSRQVVEQVKYPRIIFMNLAGAMVAQITVQARQGFRIVAFPIAVDDGQTLASVGVEKMQTIDTILNWLQFWLGCAGNQPTGENRG